MPFGKSISAILVQANTGRLRLFQPDKASSLESLAQAPLVDKIESLLHLGNRFSRRTNGKLRFSRQRTGHKTPLSGRAFFRRGALHASNFCMEEAQPCRRGHQLLLALTCAIDFLEERDKNMAHGPNDEVLTLGYPPSSVSHTIFELNAEVRRNPFGTTSHFDLANKRSKKVKLHHKGSQCVMGARPPRHQEQPTDADTPPTSLKSTGGGPVELVIPPRAHPPKRPLADTPTGDRGEHSWRRWQQKAEGARVESLKFMTNEHRRPRNENSLPSPPTPFFPYELKGLDLLSSFVGR
jgi:hypothetical protein